MPNFICPLYPDVSMDDSVHTFMAHISLSCEAAYSWILLLYKLHNKPELVSEKSQNKIQYWILNREKILTVKNMAKVRKPSRPKSLNNRPTKDKTQVTK